jgi:F-type H+-transporting ATPase subunit a
MQKKVYANLLIAVLMFITFNVNAQHEETSNDHHSTTTEEGITKEDVKETIDHHLMDSYGFHILHGVGFPLPVILYNQNGLHIFSSSALEHGEVVESNGDYFKEEHGKIYTTDVEGNLMEDGHGHHVHPLDFSITKNVFTIMLTLVVLFLLFRGMAKSYTNGLPSGFGRFMEPIIIFVRDEIAIPNIGEKHYKKFMGYLLTIFFFIWFLNLAGLMPFGFNITGNIAITFSLAIMTFILTQINGKKDYWMHIFWMPGVPTLMKVVLAPIELLGVFIKPFALMIRLYANISAGHIVLMSLIGLMFTFHNYFAGTAFFGLTVFLSLIELLVAALQAYIFTVLSALYFGMAVEEHDEHH